MSYYFLGIFVGVYYEKVSVFLKIKREELFSTKRGMVTILVWVAWLGVSFSHVHTKTTGIWAPTLAYEFWWNVHTFLSAVVLLQASYFIYRNFPIKVVL